MHKIFYRPIVAVDLFLDDIKDKIDNMSDKNKQRLQTFANCLCVGSLAAMATIDVAMAQQNTIGSVIESTINGTGQKVLSGGKWVAYVAGVFGIGSGISKFVQMTKAQSQVTGKEAAGHLIGGAGLMALGALADSAGASFEGTGATNQTGATAGGTGWSTSQ